MKYSLLLFMLMAACQQKTKNETSSVDSVAVETKKDSTQLETEAARAWLIKAIENNFNNANETEENKDAIYSKKYLEYKTDAVGVGMDGGMDLNDFNAKWKKQFDCQYAGVSTGFLISGQDYGQINVSKCQLSPMSDGSNLVFETIISDPQSKAEYKRDIKITHFNNTFLIEDVLEYN